MIEFGQIRMRFQRFRLGDAAAEMSFPTGIS
jgi:hypothetical protein